MKIVHIVPVMDGGGAQYFLYRLLERLSPRFQSEVVSLHKTGLIGEMIGKLGIPVTALDMPRGSLDIPRIFQLKALLKASRPEIVHTWMHHADLLGGLAARSAGIRNVVWEIQGDLEKEYTKPKTRMVGYACAALSHFVPQHIISCAYVSRDNHVKMGYAAGKISVIPNGCDTTVFHPDAASRRRVRAELGIDDSIPAVGMLARFHEQKRQQDFLKIAALVRAKRPNTRFFMGGRDVDGNNATLVEWIARSGLSSAVTLLGRRDDMPSVLNALDILVSPSLGEGFPLLIGEAMASGVPCVATDVGDTGYLVGDAGVTARPLDISAMAEGVERILALSAEDRSALGARARQRIVDNFDIASVIKSYEDIYDGLLNQGEPAKGPLSMQRK